MARKLPPLNSLRVFETAAQRLSFTRAAEELCVTTAAVSHQIKLLEDHLGIKLFVRTNNVLALTVAGERYLPRVREAFRALAQATDELMDENNAVLKVAVAPTFGAKWLVPRLYRFLAQHPEIRVEINTDGERNYRNSDITIDSRRAGFADLSVEPFLSTGLIPVCSPELKARIRTPSDLANVTLLHEVSPLNDADYPNWEEWLSAAGVGDVDVRQGLVFSQALMALQAAIDGQGVALAQRLLIDYDVAAGRLVRLFDIATPLRLHYYLIHAPETRKNPAFQAFRSWLLAELNHSAGE
ncbi:transcriptional regulator GcvA [Massilia sp. BJB1822]|uniref:transcriptional regulator GcvA n=1 Tax=Massilia sp. BJB1822 TaxID=2744470 RepID=UPI001594C82D|nr:transcriptional regulator GcvA [Massilia sp. BJB1822]NVD96852.1 transcriptional regulator GcvA [Massilia sp. BJB1822]